MCGCERDSLVGRLSFARVSFRFGVLSLRLLLVEFPPFDGGVNGRNPSFDLPVEFGVPWFAAGDATRASLGDMAGA